MKHSIIVNASGKIDVSHYIDDDYIYLELNCDPATVIALDTNSLKETIQINSHESSYFNFF
jgi:hypothetical protein